MASEEYGARLTADPSGFVAGAGAAGTAQAKLNDELGKGAAQSKTSAAEARNFVERLKEQADTAGKTKTELERYRASQQSLTEAQKASVEQSLKQIQAFDEKQQTLATLRTSVAVVTTAVLAYAGALAIGVKGTIDSAANLYNLSQSLGVTAEALSVYRYQSSLAGIANEEFAVGMKLLARNISEAQGGVGDGAAIFRVLGVEIEAAARRGASIEQLLPLIAERFSQFADGPNKTALALALFGRTGERLIPFLNQGASGMAELKLEAERLGVVIGGDLARSADEFNSNLRRLEANVERLKIQLASGLIPQLNRLLELYLRGSQDNGIPGGMWAVLKDVAARAPVGAFAAVPGIGPLITGAQIGYRAGGGGAAAQGLDESEALRSAMGSFATYKGGAQAPALPKPGAGGEQASEYQRFITQVGTLNAALEQQLGSSEKLTQADQLRNQVNAALAAGTLKLTDAERANLDAKLDQARASEQLLRDRQREIRLAAEALQSYEQLTSQQEALVRATHDSDVAFQSRLEMMALETSLAGASGAEREKAIEAKKIDLEIERQMAEVEGDPGRIEQLYKLAEVRKAALGAAIDDKYAAARAKDASAAAAREWNDSFKRTSDNIERALTDAIVRGGKNGRQLLEAAMRAAVLTPIISPIVRPVAQMTSGMVNGALGSVFGGGGAAGAPGYFGGSFGGGLAGMAGGLAGMAGGLVAAGNGVFQSAGVATGSQTIADIGNYGYGAPIIGGLLTYAATGNAGAGIGSTLGGIAGSYFGPVGTVIGSALGGAIGGALGGDGGDAQRTGNFAAGFGQLGGSTNNRWFSGAEMNGSLNGFAAQIAQQERNLIDNLKLSAAQVTQVNAALSPLSGRMYGFGAERSDWTQSGAAQQIAADRLQAISSALGKSIQDLTSVMSMSAEQWQQAIQNLQATQAQTESQLGQMVRALPGQLGITTLEGYQASLGVAENNAPLDRLAAARASYEKTLARARSGDLTAINAFPGAAQSFLGIGRDVYASGSGFQDIFVSVNQALNQVIDRQRATQAEILKDVPASIMQASNDTIQELRNQTTQLVNGLNSIKLELQRMQAA